MGVMCSKCPLIVTCLGPPVEEKTAVWPARTASAREKNDKYFMAAFEDGGFITVGLQP